MADYDYGALYERVKEREAREAALTAPQVSPDDMARARTIASERGLPPTVVADHLPKFDEDAQLSEVERVSKSSPSLGRFLSDPLNVALARDDLPALSKLAEAIGRTNPVLGHLLDASLAIQRGAARSRFGQQARSGLVGAVAASRESAAAVLDTTQAGARLLYGQQADPLGFRAERDQAAAVGREVRADQQASLPARPTAEQVRRNPLAALEQATAYYGGLAGQSAPLYALALATRRPGVGGALLGGTSGAMEFSSLRGEGVSDFRAAGAGVASGLIESQFERIGLSASLTGNLFAAPFVEGGTEALTALAQGQVSDLATGRQTGAAEQLAGAFDAAVVGSAMATPVSVIRAGLGTFERAARAADESRRLGDILEAAAESKTAGRAPDVLESLATDETVYVPVSAVRTLYQGDHAAFVERLTGDPGALESAGEFGDVAIPMARWVSIVGRLDNGVEWARHARTDPEGMTAAEAEAVDWDAELGALDTSEAAERAEPSEGPSAAAKIEQDVFGMLHATGRYREADAQLQAKLIGKTFETLGKRTGQDPAALYERYKLRINGRGGNQGSLDPRMDALLEAVRTGTLPSPREAYGPSLAEALQRMGGLRDAGGELRSMDAGLQRIGLINRNGMSLDAAREWAVEAGYLRDEGAEQDGVSTSEVNDLLDALDRELRGDPVFSEANRDPNLSQFRDDALRLQADIDGNEQLRSMDREAFASLSNQEVFARLMHRPTVFQRMLDTVKGVFAPQPIEQTETPEFRRWAQGAEIVESDELWSQYEGGPAVFRLFHGTTADFDVFDRDRSNPESDFGAGFYFSNTPDDVASNYAGLGPDLTQKIELEAERIASETDREYDDPEVVAEAREKWVQHDGATMPVFVRLLNPAVVGGPNETSLTFVEEYDEETDSYDEPTGTLLTFTDALRQVASRFDDGEVDSAIDTLIGEAMDGDIPLSRVMAVLKEDEQFGYYTDENGRLSSNEIMRQALERAGFDGVVDFTVDQKFGSQRRIGQAMQGMSEDTVHVIAFEPTQVKSATGNRGTFDPNDPSILHQGAERSPRGQLGIGADRSMSIDLLEGADRSTFLHEVGHFFLEVMSDLAAEDAGVAADFDAILVWGNVEGATAEDRMASWQGMDFETRRELHEAWAEGWEQYLLEGKAPSPELRGMFGRFRAWLRALYGAMLKVRVPLTDEVRAVMDRLVATDEEIEAAQVRQGYVPLFDEKQGRELGLTAKQWEAYVASLESATEEARSEVFAALHKAHQREAEKWWKEELATIREEVQAEFDATPAARAWKALSGGELTLDRDAVYAMLPGRKAWIKARILPLGVYRREGGVHPDVAASVLGYGSGAELLEALGGVREARKGIEAEASARMRERHPDPLTDGSLPERAQDAVHKHRRVKALETELGLLAQLAEQPAPSARLLNAIAERAVARKTIRALRPSEHLAHERKAAREAMKAAAQGDYAAALQAKREQVQQAALYRAARDAKDRADKAVKYLRRMGEDKARAKLGKAGHDYLEQVDGLLDRFDFRAMTGKAADRQVSFGEWVKAQEERGIALDLDPALLDQAHRKPHLELTVAELDGLRDAVKQIVHLAGLKGKLLLAGEIRDAAEIDAAMATSVREHNADRPQTTGDRSNADKLREAMMQGRAIQGTATDLARELDGFTDGGPVWDHVVRPIRDAMNRLRPALREQQEALSAIYLKHYTKDEIRSFADRVALPEVAGDAWSKRRLLSLALNWGNEGNREAILTQARNRLSPEQVGQLLSRLDARDWAFVQDVWALIDAQWPAIAAAQRARTGLAPEKVEASPFTVRTADGQTLSLPGGYFPLKYEADSVKSMRDEAEDFWNAIRMGRSAKAATRRGHTIERVGSGGRTVSLELSLVQTHLRDVLRDLHLGDAVNYVHNTLNGHGFAEALSDTGMLEHRRALELWLKDTASGEIAPRTWWERRARGLRQNFTASVLAFKVVSAAIQVTGVVQSSVVLGQAHTWGGVSQYLRRPKAMTNYVMNASSMMRERAQTHVEAVQQVMDAEAGRIKAGHAAMLRWGYFMMGQVQRTVDTSTWLGAESKGMELFGDVDKARAYADDVVIRSQATQEFVDKTPLQRGTLNDSMRQSEYLRALTVLSSYMLAKGNIAYERTKSTDFRKPSQALRWGRDMSILFLFEALIVTAIRGKWPEDDDDDGQLDDVGLLALEEGFFGVLGGIPVLGSASGSLRGYGSEGIFAASLTAMYDAYEQAKQGELDRAARKQALELAGYGTGIPAGQINKTLDAIEAERNGEDVSPHHYLTGPPR